MQKKEFVVRIGNEYTKKKATENFHESKNHLLQRWSCLYECVQFSNSQTSYFYPVLQHKWQDPDVTVCKPTKTSLKSTVSDK